MLQGFRDPGPGPLVFRRLNVAKVALLTPYATPVPGGISSFVSGLGRVLTDHGHTVTVLAGEGEGDTLEHSELGHGRRYVAKAFRDLVNTRPDVVHCHSHWYTIAAAARYAREAARPRIVFSFHTTAMPTARILFARLLREADTVTFVSAAQLAEVREGLRLGGELRILRPATDLRVPDAIAVERFAREFRLTGAFPVLAFVGPLEYRGKVDGVIDLIRGVRHVRERFPKVRLLIIGDGALRRKVEEAAEGLGGDTVTITGFLSDPKVGLANTHLYCHISRKEGLPIALLEAMSVGRCAIASRTGGIPEVIDGSNGVLVEDDPKLIAEAIYDLVVDADKRERLGSEGRKTIERHFTWGARWPLVSAVYGLGG